MPTITTNMPPTWAQGSNVIPPYPMYPLWPYPLPPRPHKAKHPIPVFDNAHVEAFTIIARANGIFDGIELQRIFGTTLRSTGMAST